MEILKTVFDGKSSSIRPSHYEVGITVIFKTLATASTGNFFTEQPLSSNFSFQK